MEIFVVLNPTKKCETHVKPPNSSVNKNSDCNENVAYGCISCFDIISIIVYIFGLPEVCITVTDLSFLWVTNPCK